MPKELVASGRVSFRAGNLLEDMPPAGFDLALVSDQATRLAPVEVRRVLTRAHAALVEGGTLAIRDRVRCKGPVAMATADSGRLAAVERARLADPRDAARRDALAALRLLVTAPGAGLHERAEYERWSVDAGFHHLRWRASADDLERAILLAEKAPSHAVSALGA